MPFKSLWITTLFLPALGQDEAPVIVGQTFMAGSADPTVGSTGWSLTSHGIAEKLFTVDEDGNIVGQVAESVQKLNTDTWQVNLKCDYKFSDGTLVTAEHVATALTRLNAENSGASASLGDMTVTALGDFQVNIQSERATPVMAAVLAEWPFVIFLNRGSEFIFTGPYKIETIWENDPENDEENGQIVMAPNEHYPRASERSHLTIKNFADGESLATALAANEVDIAFHLPVDRLTEMRAADGITVKSFAVGYQYMMFHNIRRAPLSDVLVRRAVDTVLDRQALAQEVRGGDATRSFFPENTPYHHEPTDAELHAEVNAAGALLDQAGWLLHDGIREKDGQQLTLHVVAYPQRPGLAIMHPVVGAALESLGISVNLTLTSGEGWDQLDAIMEVKDFDLLMWAQHTLPAGDPQFFLSHFFRSDSDSNHAGLNSPEVDNLIDALSLADTQTDRVMATTSAHRAIREQVPVSILITPDWHVGVSSRQADYSPWGSDYYIIRADFGLTPLSGNQQQVTSGADCPSLSDDGSGADDSGAGKVMPIGMIVMPIGMIFASVLLLC